VGFDIFARCNMGKRSLSLKFMDFADMGRKRWGVAPLNDLVKLDRDRLSGRFRTAQSPISRESVAARFYQAALTLLRPSRYSSSLLYKVLILTPRVAAARVLLPRVNSIVRRIISFSTDSSDEPSGILM